MAAVAQAFFEMDDIVESVLLHVVAPEFRHVACIARTWRTKVKFERARRLALPRSRWVLLGGGPPDLGACTTRLSAAALRVDTVGEPFSQTLPPLPCQLSDASAVVMRDGSIYVGGTCPGSSTPPYTVAHFCPLSWEWRVVASLPVARARMLITLATPRRRCAPARPRWLCRSARVPGGW